MNGSTASVSISSLAAGSHTITATYSGDTDFSGSTGSLSQSVNQVGTAMAVVPSANSAVYGQAIMLTATVATSPPSGVTPTGGTVTFWDGATTLGTATLTAGTAALPGVALPLGVNSLTANYSGNVNFGASQRRRAELIITTVAGGGSNGDGGRPPLPRFTAPRPWQWIPRGTSSSPTRNDRIREVNHATGVITTVAGNGSVGLQRRRRTGYRGRA